MSGENVISLCLNTYLTGNNQFDHPGQVQMNSFVFYQHIDSVEKRKWWFLTVRRLSNKSSNYSGFGKADGYSFL